MCTVFVEFTKYVTDMLFGICLYCAPLISTLPIGYNTGSGKAFVDGVPTAFNKRIRLKKTWAAKFWGKRIGGKTMFRVN